MRWKTYRHMRKTVNFLKVMRRSLQATRGRVLFIFVQTGCFRKWSTNWIWISISNRNWLWFGSLHGYQLLLTTWYLHRLPYYFIKFWIHTSSQSGQFMNLKPIRCPGHFCCRRRSTQLYGDQKEHTLFWHHKLWMDCTFHWQNPNSRGGTKILPIKAHVFFNKWTTWCLILRWRFLLCESWHEVCPRRKRKQQSSLRIVDVETMECLFINSTHVLLGKSNNYKPWFETEEHIGWTRTRWKMWRHFSSTHGSLLRSTQASFDIASVQATLRSAWMEFCSLNY